MSDLDVQSHKRMQETVDGSCKKVPEVHTNEQISRLLLCLCSYSAVAPLRLCSSVLVLQITENAGDCWWKLQRQYQKCTWMKR